MRRRQESIKQTALRCRPTSHLYAADPSLHLANDKLTLLPERPQWAGRAQLSASSKAKVIKDASEGATLSVSSWLEEPPAAK